jgi:uncharacterized membrane protein
MKTENKILMKQARESLKGKWRLVIGTFAVYLFINIILSSLKRPGTAISLLVSGPFAVGISLFILSVSRNKEARLEQIFTGFNRFGRSLGAFLLVVLYTALWTLLFIVPGIIAAISYSQTFFILVDDGAIGAAEAIKKSKKIMYGYKWKYFCLSLRFIGWGLLSILTLGIGFLWLIPYIQVSRAKFYDDIKGEVTATI